MERFVAETGYRFRGGSGKSTEVINKSFSGQETVFFAGEVLAMEPYFPPFLRFVSVLEVRCLCSLPKLTFFLFSVTFLFYLVNNQINYVFILVLRYIALF